MASGIDFNGDGVQFRVTGLRETLRALERAGARAEDMKDLMRAIGGTVVSAARPRTPVGGQGDPHPGRLESTLRAGRGKTKAVVRAGGARAPYAGVIHYGWPKRNITSQPFLTDALQAERQRVFEQLDHGLAELLRESHLR